MNIETIKQALADPRKSGRKETVLICLAGLQGGPSSVKSIKEFAKQIGRRDIASWNVSDLLCDSRGLAILLQSGWELTQAGQALVLVALSPSSSTNPTASPIRPTADRRIKLLFLSANVTAQAPLRIDHEARAILDRLRSSPFGSHFEFMQESALRVGDLQAALMRHRPDIVHFSGHGDASGRLFVESSTGDMTGISPTALSGMFRIVGDSIKLAVFNSCFSAAHAEQSATVLPCVVGMNDSVGDAAAIEFATGFYQGLAFARSVDESFQLGCNQIALAGLPDSAVPVLKSKAGVDLSRLTIVA